MIEFQFDSQSTYHLPLSSAPSIIIMQVNVIWFLLCGLILQIFFPSKFVNGNVFLPIKKEEGGDIKKKYNNIRSGRPFFMRTNFADMPAPPAMPQKEMTRVEKADAQKTERLFYGGKNDRWVETWPCLPGAIFESQA